MKGGGNAGDAGLTACRPIRRHRSGGGVEASRGQPSRREGGDNQSHRGITTAVRRQPVRSGNYVREHEGPGREERRGEATEMNPQQGMRLLGPRGADLSRQQGRAACFSGEGTQGKDPQAAHGPRNTGPTLRGAGIPANGGGQGGMSNAAQRPLSYSLAARTARPKGTTTYSR